VAATPGTRFSTALVVLGRGLALLVAPLTLSPDYSYDTIPVVRSVLDWRFLAAVVVVGLIGWGLSISRVRRSVVPLGVLWYAISLFPASNMLVATGTIFGERLLYLPSVAFCLLMATGLEWVSQRHRPVAVAAVTALVTAFTVQTLRYSSAWRDEISLFRWAVAAVPRSTKTHHKLGEELLRAGQLGEAVRSLYRALAIAPGNEFAEATMAVAKRHIADRYLQAPEQGEAASDAPADPDVLYVLGQLSSERGDLSEAESLWQAALSADPTHAESLADLGLLNLVRSDTASAIEKLEQAVAHKPSVARAWYTL
ncbi:MAG: DUF1736 domain-containing protein, partial [Gemmatimonadales bacterium]|nr:DUF1736 domain-containing protein [Gemmatimonadales bacterium]